MMAWGANVTSLLKSGKRIYRYLRTSKKQLDLPCFWDVSEFLWLLGGFCSYILDSWRSIMGQSANASVLFPWNGDLAFGAGHQ